MKKSYKSGFGFGMLYGFILGLSKCIYTVGSDGQFGTVTSGIFGELIWALGHWVIGAFIGGIIGLLIVAFMNASVRTKQKRKENDRIYNNALTETQNMFSNIMGYSRASTINAVPILNHIDKYDKRCRQMAISEAAKYEHYLYEDLHKTINCQEQGIEQHSKLNDAVKQLELLHRINAVTGTFDEIKITEASVKLCNIKDMLYKAKPVILSEVYGKCDKKFCDKVLSIDMSKLKNNAFNIPYPEALWALALGLSKDYTTFKLLKKVYKGFCTNFFPLDILLTEFMLTKNIGGDLWEEFLTSTFEWLKIKANASYEEYYFYLSSGLRWIGLISEEEKLLDLMRDTGMLKSEVLKTRYHQIKQGKRKEKV